MHLLTTMMMAFWIWQYLKHNLNRIPDVIIHAIIVPGASYVSWLTPGEFRSVLAATGGVLLLHTFTGTAGSGSSTRVSKRTKSNIPPPP